MSALPCFTPIREAWNVILWSTMQVKVYSSVDVDVFAATLGGFTMQVLYPFLRVWVPHGIATFRLQSTKQVVSQMPAMCQFRPNIRRCCSAAAWSLSSVLFQTSVALVACGKDTQLETKDLYFPDGCKYCLLANPSIPFCLRMRCHTFHATASWDVRGSFASSRCGDSGTWLQGCDLFVCASTPTVIPM